jgi:hypothetical protein
LGLERILYELVIADPLGQALAPSGTGRRLPSHQLLLPFVPRPTPVCVPEGLVEDIVVQPAVILVTERLEAGVVLPGPESFERPAEEPRLELGHRVEIDMIRGQLRILRELPRLEPTPLDQAVRVDQEGVARERGR